MLFLSFLFVVTVRLLTFEQPCFSCRAPSDPELSWITETKHDPQCCFISRPNKREYLIQVSQRIWIKHGGVFYVVSKLDGQSITGSLLVAGRSTADLQSRRKKSHVVKSKRTRASSSPSGFPPKGWLHTLVTHHPSNSRARQSEHTIPTTHFCATLTNTHNFLHTGT